MSYKFNCKKCGSHNIGIMRHVITHQKVTYEQIDNIVYEEDPNPVTEEYSAYICGDCGEYIIDDNNVAIKTEEELLDYLN